MQEDDLYKSSALASSRSDEGRTITPEFDKNRKHGMRNYGYTTNVDDDDDDGDGDDYDDVACVGVGANEIAPYSISNKDPYSQDCDDMCSTVSGENWTLKNSNSAMSSSVNVGASNAEPNHNCGETYGINDSGGRSDSQMRYTHPHGTQSTNTNTDCVEDDITDAERNNRDAIVTDIQDKNDIDDIKDILNKFDYLDDYHSKSISINGSSEGSAYQLEMHVDEEPNIMEFTDSVTHEDITQWVGIHNLGGGNNLTANSNGFISSKLHLEMQNSSTGIELNQHDLYTNNIDTETHHFNEDSNRRRIDELYPVEAEVSGTSEINRYIQGINATVNKEYDNNSTHSDMEHVYSEMDDIFHTPVNTLIPRTRSDDTQPCDTSDSYAIRRTISDAIKDTQNDYWHNE